MIYCCKDFENEADSWVPYFVYEESEWWIYTDMEGGRFVFSKPIKYCPFCGAKLVAKRLGDEKK